MASTTTNMQLTLWDSLTDPYDSSELVDNFVKLDTHDHTSNKGVKIPNGGLVDTSGSQAVNTNVIRDSAVTTDKINNLSVTNEKIANTAVDAAKLANSAVTEDKLANSSVTSAKIANGTIVNEDVNNSAGITYGKLNLSDSVVNADIKTNAAVAYSKLNLSNSIVNADINSSAAIVDTKLATISTAGKVANSATTANSSTGANTIVSRDASGNFAAGTITATLSGNASTATKLKGNPITGMPYKINGVDFDGTADITVSGNPTAYVTSIPSTPNDGDVIFYRADDTTNADDNSIWQLRYRNTFFATSTTTLNLAQVDIDGEGTIVLNGTNYSQYLNRVLRVSYNGSNYFYGKANAIVIDSPTTGKTTIQVGIGAGQPSDVTVVGSGTYSNWSVSEYSAAGWEYVGGASIKAETNIATQNASPTAKVNSTNYIDMVSNTNKRIVAPLAGTYKVEIWGQLSIPSISGASASQIYMSVKNGSAATSDDDGFAFWIPTTSSGQYMSGYRSTTMTVAAGTTLKTQFRTSDANNAIYVVRHGVAITPIKIG